MLPNMRLVCHQMPVLVPMLLKLKAFPRKLEDVPYLFSGATVLCYSTLAAEAIQMQRLHQNQLMDSIERTTSISSLGSALNI